MTNCYEISMSTFTQTAKRYLPGYTKMTVNDLANGYCQAADDGIEFLKDGYMAALVLRFWSRISKLVVDNPTLNLEYSDGYDWITGAISQAMQERAWIKNPKINAQQAINTIIATRYEAQAYYEANLQKNLGSFDQISLDEVIDNDNETTVGDLVEDESSSVNPLGGIQVVQTLINNNKLVEAIIIDNVLNKDVFRINKETVKVNGHKTAKNTKEFWSYKLVQELNALDSEYESDFLETYSISKNLLDAALEDLKKATNEKKYKMIARTQELLRNNAENYI